MRDVLRVASQRAGLEFVKAMWGCLFADIVAVPVPPPNPERLSASLPSFNRILEDSGAVAILTDYKFEILVSPALLKPLRCSLAPQVRHGPKVATLCYPCLHFPPCHMRPR